MEHYGTSSLFFDSITGTWKLIKQFYTECITLV